MAPIVPVRNGHRTAGGALERNAAGLCGSIGIDRNSLEISDRDRGRIVSSAQSALGLIRGKWKIAILCQLQDGPVRVAELKRKLSPISKKVLNQHLRRMEKEVLIVRTELNTNIPHVEYALSNPLGSSALSLLRTIALWGAQNLSDPKSAKDVRAISGSQPLAGCPASI
jgi:DNA-binding HxlR family transcriptional regulator